MENFSEQPNGKKRQTEEKDKNDKVDSENKENKKIKIIKLNNLIPFNIHYYFNY